MLKRKKVGCQNTGFGGSHDNGQIAAIMPHIVVMAIVKVVGDSNNTYCNGGYGNSNNCRAAQRGCYHDSGSVGGDSNSNGMVQQ